MISCLSHEFLPPSMRFHIIFYGLYEGEKKSLILMKEKDIDDEGNLNRNGKRRRKKNHYSSFPIISRKEKL